MNEETHVKILGIWIGIQNGRVAHMVDGRRVKVDDRTRHIEE